MHIEEYRSQDLCGLAALVKAGTCSAEEVRHLAREALTHADEQYACMVEIFDETRVEAPPGETDSAFLGLPIVMKDAGAHPADWTQEAGSRLFAGIPAQGETYTARRLREAGLTIIGRATTSELTYGFSAEPSWDRPTVNPWDTTRTAGGSSAGSAVVVADRSVPVAHGTDGGGSLRVPAAWCGALALKPSRGRISWGPGLSEVLFGMATEGVISRSVRDTATLLDVLSGAEPGDPYAIPSPAVAYREAYGLPIEPLRVGVIDYPIAGGLPLDPSISPLVTETAAALESVGCSTDRVELKLSSEALLTAITDVWCSQVSLMAGAVASATGRKPEEHLDPAIFQCFEHGLRVSAAQLWTAQLAFNEICRQIGAIMERSDLLVMPTANVTAPELGRLSPGVKASDAYDWTARNFAPASFTAPFNVAGLPAISLPLGLSEDGLPVGLQFVASHGREDRLLQVAHFFENAQRFTSAPPTSTGA